MGPSTAFRSISFRIAITTVKLATLLPNSTLDIKDATLQTINDSVDKITAIHKKQTVNKAPNPTNCNPTPPQCK